MKSNLAKALLVLASTAATTAVHAATPVPPTPTAFTGAANSVMSTQGANGTTSGGLMGTFTYSSSAGQSNNFAVGTSSNFGVNASASSTQDYKVQSTGLAGVGGSTLTQGIGSSMQMDNSTNTISRAALSTSSQDTGVISGSFKSTELTNSNASMRQVDSAMGVTNQNLNDTASVGSLAVSTNTVEVKGVSNGVAIKTDTNSKFTSDITARNPSANVGTSNSATASGSAGASLSTTATANSSSNMYTSTFIQAF